MKLAPFGVNKILRSKTVLRRRRSFLSQAGLSHLMHNLRQIEMCSRLCAISQFTDADESIKSCRKTFDYCHFDLFHSNATKSKFHSPFSLSEANEIIKQFTIDEEEKLEKIKLNLIWVVLKIVFCCFTTQWFFLSHLLPLLVRSNPARWWKFEIWDLFRWFYFTSTCNRREREFFYM